MLNITLISYANCHTGFACPLEKIENQADTQIHQYNKKLNKYFSKEINEDFFFSKKPSTITYNDLFIFNTIV